MKKKCKDIDITNPKTIRPFVEDCIQRHYKRYDFKRFLLEHGLTKEQYATVTKTHDYRLLDKAIDKISVECAEAIKNRKITLKIPSLTERVDITTGKVRQITCETPLHQVYDFIAERFNVPEENVIKSQYSYTVITEKEDSNGKTEMERRDRKE